MDGSFFSYQHLRTRCRSALLAAMILLLTAVAPASGGLIITRNFIGGTAPGTTTGSGNLVSIFNAAADIWESAFASSANHNVTINYSWSAFSGSTLASHSLTGQGGVPNRETLANIGFDNDGSSSWFLDGTPFDNSEYTTFTETFADLGGGLMNVGRVYTGALGAAVGVFDILTVALHEIGHALGLSSANFAFQGEAWPDNDIDVAGPLPFAGSVILTNNTGTNPPGGGGFTSNAHLNSAAFLNALMRPSISASLRRLPSAADILANAQLSQFFSPNLDPFDVEAIVPEPGSLLLLASGSLLLLVFRRREGTMRSR